MKKMTNHFKMLHLLTTTLNFAMIPFLLGLRPAQEGLPLGAASDTKCRGTVNSVIQ